MKIVRFDDISYIPASHEDPANPGVWKKILFKKADLTPGTIQMINWAKLPPGKSFAKHVHKDMEEVFIMLAGQAEITVGDEKATVTRGDGVVIPAGKPHEMKNIGIEDNLYIAMGIVAA